MVLNKAQVEPEAGKGPKKRSPGKIAPKPMQVAPFRHLSQMPRPLRHIVHRGFSSF